MILIEHATVITVDRERRMASVRTVLIDGRVVLDDGRLTTIDERLLYDRVERLSREQIRRARLPIDSKWPVLR